MDCEERIPALYDSILMDQIELTIMEENGNIYYQLWHRTLSEIFDCIWYNQDTFDPNARWFINMQHSIWA